MVLVRSHDTAVGEDELTFYGVSEPCDLIYQKTHLAPSFFLAPDIAQY